MPSMATQLKSRVLVIDHFYNFFYVLTFIVSKVESFIQLFSFPTLELSSDWPQSPALTQSQKKKRNGEKYDGSTNRVITLCCVKALRTDFLARCNFPRMSVTDPYHVYGYVTCIFGIKESPFLSMTTLLSSCQMLMKV